MELSEKGFRLLRVLVAEIERKRFDIEHPENFLGYGETIELLELPVDAPRGQTDGQTLQLNGLNDLARWIRQHPKRLPRLTGLIVSKQGCDEMDGTFRMPNVPGKGYFKEYGKNVEDWPWWLEEVRKTLQFDWSSYVSNGNCLKEREARKLGMNALERTLVEKAGYDNGWEIVVESAPEQVVLASALHRANATIRADSGGGRWLLSLPAGPLLVELSKSETDYFADEGFFRVSNDRELGHLLRHAARLARSLPNQPEVRFHAAVEKELSAMIAKTEVERFVRQRVGQNIYRESLLDYWGGACAVTGIAIPALLRASHAIPWSECQSDADRLNVFNGFLLAAHLDALFDRHLISFENTGEILCSPVITPEVRSALGMSEKLTLSRISSEHLPFLEKHRTAFLQLQSL